METLTEEQHAIIMGGLLGDNHLQKREQASYRLRVAHCSDQLEYVHWTHNKLKSLCKTTQPPTPRKPDKYGTIMWEFYTSSGMWLKPYHELFYQGCVNDKGEVKYVKTITQELIETLPKHPAVLAVLFMDDGSVRGDCYAGRIATQGFTKPECELLCNYFKEWGVDAIVTNHIQKKQQHSISIPAKSFGTFAEIIQPIVIQVPSMMYKLNEERRASSMNFIKPRND